MTTMRLAGTLTRYRLLYQALMRSRSSGRPVAWVYWLLPRWMARSAAACTRGGAVKSGSPMFKNTMGESLSATLRPSSDAALATSIT